MSYSNYEGKEHGNKIISVIREIPVGRRINIQFLRNSLWFCKSPVAYSFAGYIGVKMGLLKKVARGHYVRIQEQETTEQTTTQTTKAFKKMPTKKNTVSQPKVTNLGLLQRISRLEEVLGL